MNKLLKYLIGVIVIGMVTTSIVLPLVLEFNSNKINNERLGEIEILRNEDFSKYNFLGDGSVENPYLIENYTINTTYDYAIIIEHTTKYFVIQNCTLESYKTAIFINNIVSRTAKIIQNICRNCNDGGIFVTESNNIMLTNNICYNINGSSIEITRSDNVILRNNTCYNNKMGIQTLLVNNIILINNVCNNNSNYGILIVYSYNTELTNNVCKYNKQGILISSSDNSILNSNNCFYTEDCGIEISRSSYNILMNNNCSFSLFGVYLSFANNVTINNNVINNVSYCFNFRDTSFGTVFNNTCNFNDEAFRLYESNNNTFTNNTIKNNDGAFLFYLSSYNIVQFNYIFNNIDYAVYIKSGSRHNSLHHNIFIDNRLGENSQAEDYGVYNLWYDEITLEGNYWSDWTGVGVYTIDGLSLSFDPYPLVNLPIFFS